jgi:hypothetical protein
MWKGLFAVRIPCDVRPGTVMKYGEYDDGPSGLEAGMRIQAKWQDMNADSTLKSD